MFAKLKSFAKLNLFLKITGSQQTNNGKYHTLNSLFVPIDLSDDIVISDSKNKGLQIFFSGIDYKKINPEENTIQKVCEIVSQIYYIDNMNLRIDVQKNIPVASGMGGGSSNAAVVLNFLNNFYRLNMSLEDKKLICQSVGSDVFFFINNSVALCSGIGDLVSVVNITDANNYSVVLLKNNEKLSTKIIYDKYSQLKNKNKDEIDEIDIASFNINSCNKVQKSITLSKVLTKGLLHNDLMECAIKNYDIDAMEFVTMKARGKHGIEYFGLTGAGPTMFFIYNSPVLAMQAMYDIKQKFPYGFVSSNRILSSTDIVQNKLVVGL